MVVEKRETRDMGHETICLGSHLCSVSGAERRAELMVSTGSVGVFLPWMSHSYMFFLFKSIFGT